MRRSSGSAWAGPTGEVVGIDEWDDLSFSLRDRGEAAGEAAYVSYMAEL